MPIITACCCFETLKKGSKASGVFTSVTGLINIIIDIVIIIDLDHFIAISEPQEQFLYLPPGVMSFMGLELIASTVLVFLGVFLYVGVNMGYQGKKYLFAWIVVVVIHRIYEFFIGVYLLTWIGGHRIRDVLYVATEGIVVSVYWLLNSIIMLAALLCVISYWQELKDELFGKERRLKHYSKLANLRQAALSGHATPYRSYYNSRSVMGLESQSIYLDRSQQMRSLLDASTLDG